MLILLLQPWRVFIAMRETRALIGFMGYHAEKAHKQLCRDIFGKDESGYILSDNYELVQNVALFLCGHYGEYPDDVLYISKKGKRITIKMECSLDTEIGDGFVMEDYIMRAEIR